MEDTFANPLLCMYYSISFILSTFLNVGDNTGHKYRTTATRKNNITTKISRPYSTWWFVLLLKKEKIHYQERKNTWKLCCIIISIIHYCAWSWKSTYFLFCLCDHFCVCGNETCDTVHTMSILWPWRRPERTILYTTTKWCIYSTGTTTISYIVEENKRV